VPKNIPLQEDEIRESLTRILKSKTFAKANQLGRFLQFVVCTTLSGKESELKEYKIGTEVYDRKQSYSPSQNSIVRTEAGRLRSKLKQYYETEGKDEEVIISIRPGSYVPKFSRRGATAIENEPLPAGVSVTVLPFMDLSNNQISQACALGLGEELMQAMKRSGGFNVATLNTRFAPPAGEMYDVAELAQRLNVEAIIDGSVRSDGTVLRISCRVSNSKGFQIYSKSFDLKPESLPLLEVQERVASALVSRVSPQISKVRTMVETVAQVDFSAYPDVLIGYDVLELGSERSRKEALERFSEIAKRHPRAPRAYCGIADCYLELMQRGEVEGSRAKEEIRSALSRAKSLDADMIDVHANFAVNHWLAWNWADADAEFDEALAAGAHASTFRKYADFLLSQQDFGRARIFLERAKNIDPFCNRTKLASVRFLYFHRQFEECAKLAQEEAFGRPVPESLCYAAMALTQLKQFDRACELIQKLQLEGAGEYWLSVKLAQLLFQCDQAGAAEKLLQSLGSNAKGPIQSNSSLALTALSQKNNKSALTFLTKAVNEKEPELVWLQVDPLWDEVRQEPNFVEICQRVFSSLDRV
jgi:TolB-like protein